MAQARPVDQQAREEYLSQRYGYSRIPEQEDERDEETSANQNRAPAKRAYTNTRNYSNSTRRYRKLGKAANKNKRPKHFKSRTRLGKLLHPTVVLKMAFVWAINLFFFYWQFILGALFLVSFGAALAIADSNIASYINSIVSWFGFDPQQIFLIPWILIWIVGWLNMGIVWLFFLFSGSHSLSGNFVGDKQTRFVAALVFYALPIPILNMIPWVFIWSGFVLRNPN